MSLSTARILKHTLSLISSVENKILQRHMRLILISHSSIVAYSNIGGARNKKSRGRALTSWARFGWQRARTPSHSLLLKQTEQQPACSQLICKFKEFPLLRGTNLKTAPRAEYICVQLKLACVCQCAKKKSHSRSLRKTRFSSSKAISIRPFLFEFSVIVGLKTRPLPLLCVKLHARTLHVYI